jgi:hypothetical protein
MNRFLRYVLVGILALLAIGLSYSMLTDFLNTKKKADREKAHIEIVSWSMQAILYGFEKTNPIGRSWSLEDEASGNSWRHYFVLTFPFGDAGFPERPARDLPWQSEKVREWDDYHHLIFSLKKTDPPRNKRYTHLMAMRGQGTAFEYMQEHGFGKLRDFAPNAILLVEVSNSKVPWMQAGDLEMDKIPHEINSKDKLGIGSSQGYDQFGVGFADGEVWLLDSSIPFTELEKFLTIESAQENDREKVLGKYRIEADSAQ